MSASSLFNKAIGLREWKKERSKRVEERGIEMEARNREYWLIGHYDVTFYSSIRSVLSARMVAWIPLSYIILEQLSMAEIILDLTFKILCHSAKSQVVKCLCWKSIPSHNLAPIPSSDGNITGSDLLTNWHYHYVRVKWCSTNKGKSAVSFCHQLAAWVPNMFHNFYSVKNHKIANSSSTTKAREKICTDLEFLEF